MVLLHLLAQEVLGDLATVQAFLEQAEKEVLLVLVRVLLVVAQEGVLAKQLAPGAHHPGHWREQAEAFRRAPVGGQAGLPGLGLAPGGVQHLGFRGELVEIVPLGLEEIYGVPVLFLQADPGLVVLGEVEHGLEFFLRVPVGQLGAIQQHHTARHAAVHQPLGARAHTAHDGLAVHVAAEQFPDIGGGEDVRVDNHRSPFVTHQLGWHEAGGGKGLQVVIQPDPFDAVAQVLLALVGREHGVIAAVHDLHVEFVAVAGIAAQGVLRHNGAGNLLVVGLDEYAGFHDRRGLPFLGGNYKRIDPFLPFWQGDFQRE